MLKNYLLIIRRNLIRQPFHASLNLFCLALSITATLLMLLYISFELSYDRFHTQADRVYRVDTPSIEMHDNVRNVNWTSTPANLGPYLKQDYPEIEAFVRFYRFWRDDKVKLQHQDEMYEEEDVFAVDASVFDVFSLHLIHGDPRDALSGLNKIILSESLARKIFGEQDPVGKLLKSRLLHNLSDTPEDYTLMVSGVYADLPKNTHLSLGGIISSATDPHLEEYYFDRFNVFTYVLLPQEIDPINFAPKLSQIYKKYLNADREPVLVSAHHELTPLAHIHLKETGGLTYVYIFSAVGFLLLFLAIISYVNLITAQASNRALEIGIRKVMGSRRSQLIYQFLTESSFFALLSLIVGLILLVFLLDPLNHMLGLQLDVEQLWQSHLLWGMLAILVVLGILGGSYPAFFLSSFQPVAVMNAKQVKGKALRSILLSVQFAVVIFVLSCTAMIYDQLQFLRQKDLGFEKEQIVMLTLSGQDEIQKLDVLKQALLKNPNIVSVGSSDFTPGKDDMTKGPISADGSQGQEPQFVRRGRIDIDFLLTMNIKLVAGRNFSSDDPSDLTQSVLINKALAHDFGLDQPIGEKIRLGDKGNPNFLEVIGVVEDFHQSSLHSAIEPQLFFPGSADKIVINVENDLSTGLKHIKKSWAEVFPQTPFEYHFLDDELQNLYTADHRRGRVFFLLSLLTIFISFAGLYGLASFLAKQRSKEVGIRKVLGANLGSIVMLMTQDFLLLVCISALPAFLIARYVIGKWLENFAYRIEINYSLWVLLLLFTLILTFMTSGLHASWAALANPVDSLRNE